MQLASLAFCLARLKAGRSIAARMAMIAITTSNSISVKAVTDRELLFDVPQLRKNCFAPVDTCRLCARPVPTSSRPLAELLSRSEAQADRHPAPPAPESEER